MEIYLEMYSLDEEKFNDIEEKIYDIQNMLSDSIKWYKLLTILRALKLHIQLTKK